MRLYILNKVFLMAANNTAETFKTAWFPFEGYDSATVYLTVHSFVNPGDLAVKVFFTTEGSHEDDPGTPMNAVGPGTLPQNFAVQRATKVRFEATLTPDTDVISGVLFDIDLYPDHM
jgi:hypothetical protein